MKPRHPCECSGPVDRRPGAVRDWRICLHVEAPLGNPVCRCAGCGPSCRGYAPKPNWEPEDDDAEGESAGR